MRNLKKVLSLVLAMVMVLSMMVTANAAFADQDSINADYAEAVEVMNAIGILQGSNGNFNPNGTLTRAEAAVILSKAHSGASAVAYFENATKYTENPFSDVSGWAVPYVLYCYENDITGGTSADKYSPKAPLTGYAFAKMLLVAAGFGKHADYVSDANQTWEQKTLAAAKANGLLAGLEIALKQPISREQAAHMALNAMKAGGETTTTYYVAATAQVANVAPSAYFAKADSALEAHYAKTIIYSAGTDCYIHTVTETAGNLLADAWGVTYVAGSEDAWGRPSDNYYIPYYSSITGYAETLCFTYAPVAKFDSYTAPAAVAAALAGYKSYNGSYSVSWDTVTTPITYTTTLQADGNDYTPTLTVNLATYISSLTDANKVVEVYSYYNYITEIVTIKDYADVITATTPGDVANKINPTATVDGKTFVNAAGYVVGDVITYNLNAGAVVNTAKATGFEGKLSSYTNLGVYTVNGAPYTIENGAATAIATLTTGASKMYYPGDAGTILYVGAMPYEAPVVYGDYVWVLDTNVTQTAAVWPATGYTYTIGLKVLKADGTVAYWNLPAKAEVGGTGVYYTTGDVATLVVPAYVAYTGADSLDGMIGAVYTTNGDTIVKEVAGKADNSVACNFGVAGQTITNTTYVVDGDVFLNENTKFIMRAANYATTGAYIVKTGLTTLTETLSGAYVIASQAYDAAKDVYTRVATLVFAPSSSVYSGAVATANVVYNTGVYSVGYDATLQTTVYAYTVVNTAGAYGTAYSLYDTVAAGLYTLNSAGYINATVDTSVLTVSGVYGTTVALTNGYYIVDGDTVIYDLTVAGKGVVAGAKLFVIDSYSDKKADIVFVVG